MKPEVEAGDIFFSVNKHENLRIGKNSLYKKMFPVQFPGTFLLYIIDVDISKNQKDRE